MVYKKQKGGKFPPFKVLINSNKQISCLCMEAKQRDELF